MLNKIASSMLGLSKIGEFVSGEELHKTEASKYTIDQLEKIYYLIKTKTDEYCFTNRALIHVDGKTSVSKRNVLRRYDYNKYLIHDIYLETAGDNDFDAELKITLKEIDSLKPADPVKFPPLKKAIERDPSIVEFIVDIHRKHINELRALYKTLLLIGQKQTQNIRYLESFENTLTMAFGAIKAGKNENSTSDVFKEIITFADDWLLKGKESYSNEDFGSIFEENVVLLEEELEGESHFAEDEAE